MLAFCTEVQIKGKVADNDIESLDPISQRPSGNTTEQAMLAKVQTNMQKPLDSEPSMFCSICNVGLQPESRKSLKLPIPGTSCESIGLCETCGKGAELILKTLVNKSATSSIKHSGACTLCGSVEVCDKFTKADQPSSQPLSIQSLINEAAASCDSANVCSGCSSLIKPKVPTSCDSIDVCGNCAAKSVRSLATNPSKIQAETSCDSANVCSGCESLMNASGGNEEEATCCESFAVCRECRSTFQTEAQASCNTIDVCEDCANNCVRSSSMQPSGTQTEASCNSVNACSDCATLQHSGVQCNSVGDCDDCANIAKTEAVERFRNNRRKLADPSCNSFNVCSECQTPESLLAKTTLMSCKSKSVCFVCAKISEASGNTSDLDGGTFSRIHFLACLCPQR